MIDEVEKIPIGENALDFIAEVCSNLENEGYEPTHENLFMVGWGSHDISGGGISWSVDVTYYALRVLEYGVWVLICESCVQMEDGEEERSVDVEGNSQGAKRFFPIIADSSLQPEQAKDAFTDWLFDKKENLSLW